MEAILTAVSINPGLILRRAVIERTPLPWYGRFRGGGLRIIISEEVCLF